MRTAEAVDKEMPTYQSIHPRSHTSTPKRMRGTTLKDIEVWVGDDDRLDTVTYKTTH